ncbi:MAG: CBS domain-containing protein [Nitrosotalea sp.]
MSKSFLFQYSLVLAMGLVRDIMVHNVVTIEHDKTAKDVAMRMAEKGISSLVVVKEGTPIGLVTERDLARKVSSTDKKSSEVPLADIMSANFRWVEPMTPIEDAVQKMTNKNIRRLLVLDNGKLAGIITETDLARYLRSKLLIEGAMDDVTALNRKVVKNG